MGYLLTIKLKSMPTKKRGKTKFQKLQAAKKAHCAEKKTKAEVIKFATAYIADAVKKGNKTKAQATSIANKVLKKPCFIAGTKKKTTRKKKR